LIAFERKSRAGPCHEHLHINLGQPLATIHASMPSLHMTVSKEVAREAGHPLSQFARVDDKLAHGVTADGADVPAVAESLDEALTLIIAEHHLEARFLALLLERLEHLCQVLG